ncbi:hypothetical protein KRP22_014161 [Phytophthora ramorum]|nr:Crinkler effector protein 1 [Phytophthora ramorum]
MDVASETWSFGDSPQFFKTLFWRLENAPPGHNSPVVRKPAQDGATWPVLFERLQQLDQLFQAWHDQLRGLFVCHGQQKDQDEAATAQRKRGKSLDETASEDGYSSGEDGPGERSTLRGLSTSTNQARPRSKTLSDCHLEANCTRKPPVPIAANSQVAQDPRTTTEMIIEAAKQTKEVGWAIACLNHIGGVMRDISQFLLLSCFSSWDVVPVSVPFGVKGTTEMMIIDDAAKDLDDVFAGLHFVIELKKDHCGAEDRCKILVELVAADLKSEKRCAPIGLLTNLNDYWYFLWFTPEREIARMMLTCPANGFKMMEELTLTNSRSDTGVFPMRTMMSQQN